MLKRWLVLVALLCAAASDSIADACASGTLESYINNPQGCTIGDKLFGGFGFNVEKGQANAGAIFITPDTRPGNPGLVFSTNLDTTFGAPIILDLKYTVIVQQGGNLIEDNDLNLDNAGTQGNGSVDIQETKCLGAAFGSNGCPTGKTIKLEVMTGPFGDVMNAHATFSPVAVIGVEKHIVLDAPGKNDFAFLSQFSQHYSEVAEPATVSSVIMFLLTATVFRLRRGPADSSGEICRGCGKIR